MAPGGGISTAGMKFRPSAIFPLLLSGISFVLVLLLVLSGTNPTLVQDAYILKINTTDFGNNLVLFNPVNATPSAVPSAVTARSIHGNVRRTSLGNTDTDPFAAVSPILAGIFNTTSSGNTLNTTSTGNKLNSTSTGNTTLANAQGAAAISVAASSSSQISTTAQVEPTALPESTATQAQATSSTTPSVPTLTVPAVAASAAPASGSTSASSALSISTVPIGVLQVFFQLVLNAFATGIGAPLQAIVTLLITTQKASLSQYITTHLGNICEGPAFNASAPIATADYPFTECPSYTNLSTTFRDYTATFTDDTDVVALNITVPILRHIPGAGESAKSLLDFITGLIKALFIIHLLGSGISFLASLAAFFLPANAYIVNTAALVTTLTLMPFQTVTFLTSGFAHSVASQMNSLTPDTGLSAEVGTKYLTFLWIGFIAMFMANAYWMTVWFVEFRARSYKARARTPMEMGDYKGINREVLSDIRLKREEVDSESMVDIQHTTFESKGQYERM